MTCFTVSATELVVEIIRASLEQAKMRRIDAGHVCVAASPYVLHSHLIFTAEPNCFFLFLSQHLVASSVPGRSSLVVRAQMAAFRALTTLPSRWLLGCCPTRIS